jgi:hypothetical protein
MLMKGRPFALLYLSIFCYVLLKHHVPKPLSYHTHRDPTQQYTLPLFITHTPPQNVICHFRLVRYVWVVVGGTALMREQ